MQKRILGKTGLQVSEVGFGCWAIGGTSYGPTSDRESIAALESAWDLGVNFFDTADTYGHGHSEKLVAQFLKNKSREQVIIASKVGWDFYNGPSKKNFDPEYISFACEETLKRLKTEYLDLYQLHNPKPEIIRQGDAIRALEKLKQEGKIRFIGVSIHTEADAQACLEFSSVDSFQLVFNLLEQKMARQVFGWAKEKNIGVIAREPLACGLLSGKYQVGHQFAKDDHRRRWLGDKLELDLRKVAIIKEFISSQCESVVKSSIEYVLSEPAVSVVIPGAKTAAQFRESAEASSLGQLSPDILKGLRQLTQNSPLFSQELPWAR